MLYVEEQADGTKVVELPNPYAQLKVITPLLPLFTIVAIGVLFFNLRDEDARLMPVFWLILAVLVVSDFAVVYLFYRMYTRRQWLVVRPNEVELVTLSGGQNKVETHLRAQVQEIELDSYKVKSTRLYRLRVLMQNGEHVPLISNIRKPAEAEELQAQLRGLLLPV